MKLRDALVPMIVMLASAGDAPATRRQSGSFIAETTDSLGNGWRVDQISWYVAPQPGMAVVQVPGSCDNAACTRWRWDPPPDGDFYIEAIWSSRYPVDPLCIWSAYDARPVHRDPGTHLTVVLQLQSLLACE